MTAVPKASAHVRAGFRNENHKWCNTHSTKLDASSVVRVGRRECHSVYLRTTSWFQDGERVGNFPHQPIWKTELLTTKPVHHHRTVRNHFRSTIWVSGESFLPELLDEGWWDTVAKSWTYSKFSDIYFFELDETSFMHSLSLNWVRSDHLASSILPYNVVGWQ